MTRLVTNKMVKSRVLLPLVVVAFVAALTVFVWKESAALEHVGLRGLYFSVGMALVLGVYLVCAILSYQYEAYIVSYLSAVTILVAIGLSYQFLFEDFLHHLVTILVGIVSACVAFVLWRRLKGGLSRPMYRLLLLTIFGLLVVNLLLGTEVNGARLWIVVGGFSFQPGELVKVLLIVLGSASFRNARRGILYCVASICSCAALLYLRDLGGAATVFALFLLMSYLLFDNRLFSLSLMGSAVAGFVGAIRMLPYAAQRMASWGNAMTETGSWQQRHYIIGVLLGGFDGLGLQDAHWYTDVFSANSDGAMGGVMAVYGVPVAMIAMISYAVLAAQALLNHSVYTSSYFIHAQLGMYLFVQVLLSFCGALDLLPFTGITSLLISAGGSSVVCSFLLIGLGAAALAPKITTPKEGINNES